MTKSKSSDTPSCEQLIDMFPQPFVVIDKDHTILAANRAYCEHYESHHQSVIGRHCYEVSHHSTVPCSQHGEHCPLETVFETGQPTQVMHIHYDKDGIEEYVQLQANPILGADNEVLFMGETINPVASTNEDESPLIGRSRPMFRLLSLLQRVAPTQTTVFLLGESGVGKERAAQYIHQFSKRSHAPFVVVDCGTLGENLIESELFGHEKGAFTGATTRKKGLFEAANGGTLFIDEIGELSLPLQTNLLRAMETGTIRRLGGTEYIDIDVRIVVATNRDAQAMVANGQFRQDLYYRLSAFPVVIPPLRDHKDDVRALAEHFLTGNPDSHHHVPLSPEVIEALMSYDYPGNVRELRNVVERASILAYGDVLRPEHLVFENAPDLQQPISDFTESTSNLLTPKERITDERVMEALHRSGGHRGRAAALLGVSERTLYRHVSRLRSKIKEPDRRFNMVNQ